MENQNLDTRIRAADDLYTDAKLEAALKAYQDILAADDTVAWAYSRIGAIRAQMSDLFGAEEALARAIELDPALPQAHSNLGNIYYARGEFEKALAKYKEAVALDQNNPTFHENLHAAYKKLGKLTEAVASLKQAHRLDREQGKAEAKARMTAIRENITKRRGCLGSTVTLLAILVIATAILFAILG